MADVPMSVWSGIRTRLQNMALGITGHAIRIREIPEGSSDLGYTSGEGDIHLSFTNKIIKEIPERDKKIMFVKGVFTHELMHKIATDFTAHKRMIAKMDRAESRIFHEIFNILEDAAIEFQAPAYIGGHLLKALNFMCMHLYRISKPLEEYSDTPFYQFSSAMIQYGDGGVLKGHFTHDEARKIFHQIIPIYNKNLSEKKGKKRIQNAYDIFLASKPLWQPELEDAKRREEFLSKLAEWMEENGLTSHEGGGSSIDMDPDDDMMGSGSEKKERRRKVTYRKISKEEMERLRSESGEGCMKDDSKSDIEILYCDEDTDEEPGEGEDSESPSVPAKPKIESGKASFGSRSSHERKEKETGKKKDDEEKSPHEGRTDGEEELEAGKESAMTDGSGKDGADSEPLDSDEPSDDVISDEEYEISPEDIARIKAEVNDIRSESEEKKIEADMNHKEDLDIPEMEETHKGITCKNVRVVKGEIDSLQESYDKLLEPLAPYIKTLTNTLDRIFRNEASDREYRASGRVNIKRLQSGRMTTRVFDRKKDPANRSDCCVLFLVDESGSMRGGSKHRCARSCVIGLTEVFAKLHIPVSVIGFTADEGGSDVVHYHYMRWLNTPGERLNLLNITARTENFDGYSVRYAAKTIAKRPEKHKFLIVLSDGAPACNHYYHHHNGVQDTSNAIREAKKTADVIGVAIGNSDTETIFGMYGADFVHVSRPEDLFTSLGKVIKDKVKRWE